MTEKFEAHRYTKGKPVQKNLKFSPITDQININIHTKGIEKKKKKKTYSSPSIKSSAVISYPINMYNFLQKKKNNNNKGKGIQNGKEKSSLKRQNNQQEQTLIYDTDVGNSIGNLKQK